eukprot:evm.model.scf_1926EXC.2 EVM.evm.TU.scf_1926EXC.2   scf_1926EXC:13617-16017(+)
MVLRCAERQLLVTDDALPRKRPNIVAPPRSKVLAAVAEFLPVLKEAQKQLDQQMKNRPEEVNMEQCDETAEGEQRIEMSIDCGVIDLLDEEAVLAAQRAMTGAHEDSSRTQNLPGCSDKGSGDSEPSCGADSTRSREEDGNEEGAIDSPEGGTTCDQGRPCLLEQRPRSASPSKKRSGAKRTKIVELS